MDNINEISGPITDVNLTGKVVVVKKDFFNEQYAEGDRRFLAESGFGCNPSLMGKAVFGHFLDDGEKTRIERYDIEGLAANTEIESTEQHTLYFDPSDNGNQGG
jgi:hypothetical protein